MLELKNLICCMKKVTFKKNEVFYNQLTSLSTFAFLASSSCFRLCALCLASWDFSFFSCSYRKYSIICIIIIIIIIIIIVIIHKILS